MPGAVSDVIADVGLVDQSVDIERVSQDVASAAPDSAAGSNVESQGFDPSQGFNMETNAAAAGFNMESAGFDPSVTGHDTSQGYDPAWDLPR